MFELRHQSQKADTNGHPPTHPLTLSTHPPAQTPVHPLVPIHTHLHAPTRSPIRQLTHLLTHASMHSPTHFPNSTTYTPTYSPTHSPIQDTQSTPILLSSTLICSPLQVPSCLFVPLPLTISSPRIAPRAVFNSSHLCDSQLFGYRTLGPFGSGIFCAREGRLFAPAWGPRGGGM